LDKKEYDSWDHFCETIFPDNPEGIIVVVTMYLDAAFKSKKGTTEPLFHTLAGFAATVKNWKKFRKEWSRELAEKNVDHFHMTRFEFAKNKRLHGQQSHQKKNPFNDFTLPEFDPMFERMVKVMCQKSDGKFRLYSYGSSILHEDFYANRPDSLKNDVRCANPYVFNAYCLFRIMAMWIKKFKTSKEIAYVFAEGDTELGQLQNLLLFIKSHPKVSRELRIHWSNNEVLKEAVMKDVNPIQAADILAFETQAHITQWNDLGRPRRIEPSLSRPYLNLLAKEAEYEGSIYTKAQLNEEFADILALGKWVL
jgi:hypothetical protein